MSQDEGPESESIQLERASIQMGDDLVVEPSPNFNFVGLIIWIVEELEDSWRLSAPLEEREDGRLTCPAARELEVGLYLIVAAQIPSSNDLPDHFRPEQCTIIEIVDAGPDQDLERIGDRYRQVKDHREREAVAGIGEGAVSASALVFVEDILVTTSINFRNYRVEPVGPVGWSAEVQAVQNELGNLGLPDLNVPPEVQSRIDQARPSITIRFPLVHADSVDDCARLAEEHSRHVVNVLALERGSLGKIYCVIAWNSDAVRFRMATPQYSGNLIGGFASGEDPGTLRKAIEAVQSDSTLEFYLVLFGEAVREERAEFKFARLWSFLESVARGRDYIGKPLRSWDGSIVKNRNGQYREIQDDAYQLVFEMLRDLSQYPNEDFYGGGLSHPTIGEQLTIIYQRRNCIIHGGPCLCRGSSETEFSAGRLDRARMCAGARSEIDLGFDPYIRIAEELAELALRRVIHSS